MNDEWLLKNILQKHLMSLGKNKLTTWHTVVFDRKPRHYSVGRRTPRPTQYETDAEPRRRRWGWGAGRPFHFLFLVFVFATYHTMSTLHFLIMKKENHK